VVIAVSTVTIAVTMAVMIRIWRSFHIVPAIVEPALDEVKLPASVPPREPLQRAREVSREPRLRISPSGLSRLDLRTYPRNGLVHHLTHPFRRVS
jgi:hypothetical protein